MQFVKDKVGALLHSGESTEPEQGEHPHTPHSSTTTTEHLTNKTQNLSLDDST